MYYVIIKKKQQTMSTIRRKADMNNFSIRPYRMLLDGSETGCRDVPQCVWRN